MILFVILQSLIINSFSDNLFDPYKIEFADECCMVISDYADRDRILKLIDIETGSIINYIPEGRGPGEIANEGLKLVSRFSNGDFLIWDSNLFRGARFDHELNYIEDINHGGNRIAKGLLLNDSLLVSIEFVNIDELFVLYNLSGNQLQGINKSIKADVHQLLHPLSANHLLRQGTFIQSDGLLAGVRFSSIMIRLDDTGEINVSYDPVNLALPEGQEPEVSGYETTYSAPSVVDNPMGILDMAADSDYIYTIITEESGSKFRLLLNSLSGRSGKILEMLDELNHSNRLFIYEKNTGDFLREVSLPISAKSIAVNESYVFLLNSLDEPKIFQYKKNIFKIE